MSLIKTRDLTRGLVSGLVRGSGVVPPPAPTYATWNPDDSGYSAGNITNENLTLTGFNWLMVRTTVSKEDDEWSVEFTVNNSAGTMIIGVCNATAATGSFLGSDQYGYGWYSDNGNVLNNGGGVAVYSSWGAVNDKLGIKFNATARTVRFYKNGVAQGAGALDISALTGPLFIGASCFSGGDVITLNAGQSSFSYDYAAANVGLFV